MGRFADRVKNMMPTQVVAETDDMPLPPLLDTPIPAPVQKPAKRIAPGDKLEMQFGDWVHLVCYHYSQEGKRKCPEITRTTQNRLWDAYNVNPSPFHAQTSIELLN